jgi:hypothetical protein
MLWKLAPLPSSGMETSQKSVACDNGQCPINAAFSQTFGKSKCMIVKSNQRFTIKHY